MDFKSIIKEQRGELEEMETRETIIKRSSLGFAEGFLRHPNILAVIGARRCGKSVLSYLIAKGHKFGYINLDDERLIGITAGDLDRILEAFYELYGDIDFIVLDEIQNVRGWELFVNRLRRTKRVIVTGSSSRMLSGELATHLTGRYIDIKLFPFSFAEFLDTKQFKKSPAYTTREKAEIMKFLNEYLIAGGFPEVKKFGKPILRRIYDDIITKDILLRYKIKKKDDIRRLAMYAITNFSEEISYTKMAKILGVKHVSTISNWISYLESSFLVFKLERFDFKLKQQFIAPKKIYCIDNGIVNSVGFRFMENVGKLMENAVAVELQRKTAEEPSHVYYWKDYQQHEVDFVIKDGLKVKQLVQVTYASSKYEVKEREIKGLLKASKELRCKDLLVITWGYEGSERTNGRTIRFVPLWKWLLDGR